jgi:hypothetical protein
MMAGKGALKKKIAMKAVAARASITRFFKAFAPTQNGLKNDGKHGCFQSEKQCSDDTNRSERSIDPAQNHDGDDAGQNEQSAGDQPTLCAVQKPANVSRKLLRLGTGQ